MLENAIREGYNLREGLKNISRFDYEDTCKLGVDVFFKDVKEGAMIQSALHNGIGNQADCNLLYLMSKLQFADLLTLKQVLEVYKNQNKALDMIEEKDLQIHLKKLRMGGFVGHTDYKTSYGGQGEEVFKSVKRLYSVTDFGMRIMNQTLKKRITFEHANILKPLHEKIGLASNANTISCCMRQGKFEMFVENYFVSKEMNGRQAVPCVARFGSQCPEEEKYRVCFIPAYLLWDKSVQTEEDYKESCRFLSRLIKNWLGVMARASGTPVCIITVKDNADLNKVAKLFFDYRSIAQYLNNIYFTGEGILKEDSVQNKALDNEGKEKAYKSGVKINCNFLKMRISADGESFDLYKDTPPFLETNL
ncbi:MAG: hypothetical protein IJN92_03800 [Lachnospiraceae bacterium]|nr:hypothetical protein [Lachnospiraceae bacterium]